MSRPESEFDPEGQGVVFRDKRRLDPETGAVRKAAGSDAGEPAVPAEEAEPVRDEVADQVTEL
ncbi:MAG: hypothetical protein JWM40_257, partial [Frankiales bacterium]|nr:hypothetical protein [Frankiales bacterium]